ncbi:MAG: single-stranded DNA-binding protein, partial [Clostridiales bacterium]|nr:single-stranded DNA-binding protein [Candidatus Coliplasma caballi]
MAFNKVILMGNLVADPELKKIASGNSVTTIRLAVSRRFSKLGDRPEADFFDVVCWGQTAEFVCRYFTKGRPILV